MGWKIAGRFLEVERDFSLLDKVQVISGAHPASYLKSIRAVSPGGKVAWA
jgi:hypothetical protein